VTVDNNYVVMFYVTVRPPRETFIMMLVKCQYNFIMLREFREELHQININR